MWYFRVLFHMSIVNAYFELWGPFQENNKVFILIVVWFFLIPVYLFIHSFFFKSRSTRTYIHVYVCGYVWVLVCLSHLIYWPFKPTVGILTYLSASDFFFRVYHIHVVCMVPWCAASVCSLPEWVGVSFL